MTRTVITGGPRTGKSYLAAALDIPAAPGGCEICGSPTPGGRFSSLDGHPGDSGPCPRCASIPYIRHTDHLIHLGWSEASAAAALWLDVPGPWIVEGVAAPRALRKWLAAHPDGRPCDVLIVLPEPRAVLTPGQVTMTKGCVTVLREIWSELERRGVEIRVVRHCMDTTRGPGAARTDAPG